MAFNRHWVAACLAVSLLPGCESVPGSDPLQNIEGANGRTSNSGWGSSIRRADQVTSARDREQIFDGVEQAGSGDFLSKKTQQTPPAQRTGAAAERFTLNLVDASVAQAAKSVLGEIMGVNYTIAEKVAGKITIQTTSPMYRDEIVGVFENALRSNGAALVKSDGHYRIVLAADAVQGGPITANGARRDGFGVQTQIVTLKYVSPSEIKRIVDAVAPQGVVLKIDDNRNTLILSGSSRELADVTGLITLFDVDWMRGMSFALIPVQSSDPDAVSRELETLLGLDKDSPMKGSVRIIPNRRLSSIMVISTKPHVIETAKTWIRDLDKIAEGTEERLFVYKIRNRAASELAAILTRVLVGKDQQQSSTASLGPRFEPAAASTTDPQSAPDTRSPMGTGTRSAQSSSGPQPQPLPTSASGGPTAGGPAQSASLSGGTIGQSTIDPDQRSFGTTPSLSPSTPPSQGTKVQKVVADEANNALLITTTKKEYTRILQILDRVDVLPTQVMLEALIAEVTLTDELKFGVKWAIERGQSKFTLSDRNTGAIAANFPGFNYFFAASNIAAAVDALQSITKVNVASAPTLMVLDNRKATLQIGDQVPIVTQQAQNTNALVTPGTLAVNPIINSITMKDTGIILNVTPRVSESGRVVLDIEQEVSNVVKTTSSGIDSPTIQQRRIRTTVVVTDGEVVALGGLIQERDTITKSQIPVLGNIPLVGTAFRQKEDKIERTELLIFIRPQVVRNRDEAREVTEEFRNRISLQTPASLKGRNEYDRDAKRIAR